MEPLGRVGVLLVFDDVPQGLLHLLGQLVRVRVLEEHRVVSRKEVNDLKLYVVSVLRAEEGRVGSVVSHLVRVHLRGRVVFGVELIVDKSIDKLCLAYVRRAADADP